MAIPNPNPNIADGIKCDNKTYSSNKIESLISQDPVIYTETERQVGSWIDDSAIYQKTVTLSNQTIPKNDALNITVADLANNIDVLISCEILCDIGTDILILPYSYGASAFANFITEVAASKTTITLTRGNSADLTGDLIITLRYTKTA